MKLTLTNCEIVNCGTVLKTDHPDTEFVASGTTFINTGKIVEGPAAQKRDGLNGFAGSVVSGLAATAIGRCMGF